MKYRAVVFTRKNAYVLKSADYAKLLYYPNLLLNPNLDYVRTVPPHFWKMEAGEIQEMTEEEKQARRALIESQGIDNERDLEVLRTFQAELDAQAEIERLALEAIEEEERQKKEAEQAIEARNTQWLEELRRSKESDQLNDRFTAHGGHLNELHLRVNRLKSQIRLLWLTLVVFVTFLIVLFKNRVI